MKKIIALTLAVLLVLCVVGCGKKDDTENGASAVEEYASSGRLTDCEFALGDKYSDVLSAVEKAAEESEEEEHEHPEYSTYEDENYKIIDSAEYKYYFGIDDDILVHIAAFEDAYGFNHGSVISTVKDALANSGYKAETEALSDEEAFFLYGSGNRQKLEYKFGDNTVMFIFEESALCATVLSAE